VGPRAGQDAAVNRRILSVELNGWETWSISHFEKLLSIWV
jgi:hypothetical protein